VQVALIDDRGRKRSELARYDNRNKGCSPARARGNPFRWLLTCGSLFSRMLAAFVAERAPSMQIKAITRTQNMQLDVDDADDALGLLLG
jgi:hypothetical protein